MVMDIRGNPIQRRARDGLRRHGVAARRAAASAWRAGRRAMPGNGRDGDRPRPGRVIRGRTDGGAGTRALATVGQLPKVSSPATLDTSVFGDAHNLRLSRAAGVGGEPLAS